jgi:hypothetical protein
MLLIDSFSDLPGSDLYCLTNYCSFLISLMVRGLMMVFFFSGSGAAKKSIWLS